VLVVVAHPDDAEFGAGGTVARWCDEGAEVVYCVVTDGAAGGSDPAVPDAELAALRRREQEAAAAVLGVSEVVFLGRPDGRLVADLDLRRDLARVIRKVRPGRVLAQSPERNYRRIRASHPDHLAAGAATLAAVYPDARNPLAFRELLAEGLAAHAVREVWLMAAPTADHPVDVTEVFGRKLEALRCHGSQVGDGEGLEGVLRGFLDAEARRFGLPPGRLAESFLVVDTG
jgi:LmbE family N-acetylglucosaminyl deacetylase